MRRRMSSEGLEYVGQALAYLLITVGGISLGLLIWLAHPAGRLWAIGGLAAVGGVYFGRYWQSENGGDPLRSLFPLALVVAGAAVAGATAVILHSALRPAPVYFRGQAVTGVNKLEALRVTLHATSCDDSGKYVLSGFTKDFFVAGKTFRVYSCSHTHPRHEECVAIIGRSLVDVTKNLVPDGLPSAAVWAVQNGVAPECLVSRPHW